MHTASFVASPVVNPSPFGHVGLELRHAPVSSFAENVVPSTHGVHDESVDDVPAAYPLPAPHDECVHILHAVPSGVNVLSVHGAPQCTSAVGVPVMSGIPAEHVGSGLVCAIHANLSVSLL